MRRFLLLSLSCLITVFSFSHDPGKKRSFSLPTDYFRSITTGNWNNTSTWESSPDGSSWSPATLTPDNNAKTISIQNGTTVTALLSVTVDEVVIKNGGTLVNQMPAGNTLTINDGTGDDIDIQSGGIYQILSDQGYASYQTLSGSATIHIESGGMIRVGNGAALAGTNNSNLASTSTSYIWDTDAVFDWNVAGAFNTSSTTYFPDAAATIPIFRISANVGTVGAATATTFNGLLEANGNVTFNNSGQKTFRNGIIGIGDITGSTGAFVISGPTAKLGGSGNLFTPASGLDISGGATVSMTSNKYVTGKIDLLGLNTHIVLGNFNLTATTTVNITETSSWVKTDGTGHLTINSVSAPYPFFSKIFPVGLSTVNPLIIASAVTENYSVRVTEPVTPSIFDPTRAVLRTWFVSDATGQVPDIYFGYTHPGDAGVNFVNSNLQIGVYLGGAWSIHQYSLTPNSFPFGTNTWIVKGTAIPYFSAGGPEIPFAVADNGAILPLDYFVAARAQKSNNTGIVSWKVFDESTVHNFEVQRSLNGAAFVTIGTVNPVTNQLDYSFTDAHLEKGTSLYRILINRNSGGIKYSNTVALINDSKGLLITSILPNPVRNELNLVVSTAKPGFANFEVFDISGHRVSSWQSNLRDGNNTISRDMSALPSGVYHIVAWSADVRAVGRFVKNSE